MAPALATALKVVPGERGWTLGSTIFADLLTRPIPRSLWPDKPLSPREEIIRQLWPWEHRLAIANPEFSVLLYPYMDFGLIGVFVWMALYGFFFRAIFERFRRSGASLNAQILFAMVLPVMPMALRDGPTDVFQRLVFGVIPAIIVTKLATRRIAAPRPEAPFDAVQSRALVVSGLR